MASSDFARQLLYSAGFEDIQAVRLTALQGFSLSLPGGHWIPVVHPGLFHVIRAELGLKQECQTGKPCFLDRHIFSTLLQHTQGRKAPSHGMPSIILLEMCT